MVRLVRIGFSKIHGPPLPRCPNSQGAISELSLKARSMNLLSRVLYQFCEGQKGQKT